MKQLAEEKTHDRDYIRVRGMAFIAMLVCLATALSWFERFIPLSFTVPGIKLGLANLVVLAGIYLLPFRQALTLVMLKCVMTAWIFGSFVVFLYSLAGSLLSFAVMYLPARFFARMPVVAVSIAGGVSHNLGQLAVAAIILRNPVVFYYLPVLTVAGVVTGALIGVCVRAVLPELRRQGGFR
ncbi:MAG: Gx transporter family protein [Gracilibacteraceae bacterium]|jgi:heptaprenyl diphosphate synthase|nr:Gx transporter family protein [Gracilibacteraceae bacterium]